MLMNAPFLSCAWTRLVYMTVQEWTGWGGWVCNLEVKYNTNLQDDSSGGSLR